MPLIRKQIPLDAFVLTGPDVMFSALTVLISQGWRGGINAAENGAMRLEVNADNPTRQIVATVGDVLVDDLGWRLLSAEQAQANYDEVVDE